MVISENGYGAINQEKQQMQRRNSGAAHTLRKERRSIGFTAIRNGY